jgi:uncharacterized membrane protein YphA (DoxX/SURF4 family)
MAYFLEINPFSYRSEQIMLATKVTLSSIYIPLRLVYGLVPIVAGADKFFNLLTDWQKYLPQTVASALPISPAAFMHLVGIIEIVAGLAVLTKLPRLGAYVVMIWLLLISVNLVMAGYFDIAVRDVVMAIGAYTLGQVAAFRGESWFPSATPVQGVSTYVAAR